MLTYTICLDMPEGGVSNEFDIITIPARSWAVFPLVLGKPGAWENSIISVWKRIFPEWFPRSGYEMDTGPRQERHYWNENGKMVAEAWIPVIKKYGAK